MSQIPPPLPNVPDLVRAKGIYFVPASGRNTGGMFQAMEELGEDLIRDGAPFISMSGLTVSTSEDVVVDRDEQAGISQRQDIRPAVVWPDALCQQGSSCAVL